MLMAINMKMYDDSFITLMMEVVKAFETTINIYQSTRCCFPEDRHLCRRLVWTDDNFRVR
jgi:hypothetical protein